jgi:hypothetical protein
LYVTPTYIIATGPDKEWFIPVTWGESQELKLSQWINIKEIVCNVVMNCGVDVR